MPRSITDANRLLNWLFLVLGGSRFCWTAIGRTCSHEQGRPGSQGAGKCAGGLHMLRQQQGAAAAVEHRQPHLPRPGIDPIRQQGARLAHLRGPGLAPAGPGRCPGPQAALRLRSVSGCQLESAEASCRKRPEAPRPTPCSHSSAAAAAFQLLPPPAAAPLISAALQGKHCTAQQPSKTIHSAGAHTSLCCSHCAAWHTAEQ